MHLKFFSLERKLYLNSFKIILSTIFMGILFYYLLFHFDHLLYYSNNFKFLSLLVIIGLSALFYVLECYIFGLLKFKNFKIDKKLFSYAKKDCIFLHCLPRGKEVDEKIFYSKQSKVWQQALNRVHVQKSILLYCFGKLR